MHKSVLRVEREKLVIFGKNVPLLYTGNTVIPRYKATLFSFSLRYIELRHIEAKNIFFKFMQEC